MATIAGGFSSPDSATAESVYPSRSFHHISRRDFDRSTMEISGSNLRLWLSTGRESVEESKKDQDNEK